MKNPEEKLDQLRRSSLIEFEHLKKDEHPNPPMRALPEHSVVEKKEAGTSFGLDGANDQAVPGSFPHIAEKDFASSDPAPDVRPGFGDRSFAHVMKTRHRTTTPSKTFLLDLQAPSDRTSRVRRRRQRPMNKVLAMIRCHLVSKFSLGA